MCEMSKTFEKIIGEHVGELYKWQWEDIEKGINKYYMPRPVDKHGEPIRIGDRVWTEGSIFRDEIKELRISNKEDSVVCENGVKHQVANVFLHILDVFDAGGRKLEKGDCVWRLSDGVKGEVIRLNGEAQSAECLFQDYPLAMALDSTAITKKFW